jgi:hypothetical protein
MMNLWHSQRIYNLSPFPHSEEQSTTNNDYNSQQKRRKMLTETEQDAYHEQHDMRQPCLPDTHFDLSAESASVTNIEVLIYSSCAKTGELSNPYLLMLLSNSLRSINDVHCEGTSAILDNILAIGAVIERTVEYIRDAVAVAILSHIAKTLRYQRLTLHLVRQHQAGRQSNPYHDENSYEVPTNGFDQLWSDNVRPFIVPYLPAPGLAPRDPNENPEMVRRCRIGRPNPKVLHRGDRYFHLSLCDKHGRESLHSESMRINGGVREAEHAWKCM